MSIAPQGQAGIDYRLTRYDSSRLLVRGPRRPVKGPYFCVLGGTEAFGRFVAVPLADRLERAMGVPVANLAGPNFGLDTFLGDEGVMRVARAALGVVVQVTGAQNLSNPFYRVHPRRNDRLLSPTEALRDLYPEVDFSEINFTRHLLTTLAADPARFAQVEVALRTAWEAGARALCETLSVPVTWLWMAGRRPEEGWSVDRASDPLLVDRALVDRATDACGVLIDAAHVDDGRDPVERGLIFDDLDRPLAAQLPGPAAHQAAADRLLHVLVPLLRASGMAPGERRIRRRS